MYPNDLATAPESVQYITHAAYRLGKRAILSGSVRDHAIAWNAHQEAGKAHAGNAYMARKHASSAGMHARAITRNRMPA